MAQPQTLSGRIQLRKQKLLELQPTTKSGKMTALEQRIAKSKNSLLQTSKTLDQYLTWNSLLLTGSMALYRLLKPKK